MSLTRLPRLPGALALTLALAACQPAAFTGAPGQPAPATGASAAPSAKPNLPPIQVTTTSFSLQGVATVNGQPLAGASIQAFDAITNKAVNIVAAGGGKVVAAGGGNIVASGAGNRRILQSGLNTNTEGLFNATITGVTRSRIVRVVVKGLRNGKPIAVTRLVSAAQLASGGKLYQLMQTRSLPFDEKSTYAEREISNALKDYSQINERGLDAVDEEIFNQVKALEEQIAKLSREQQLELLEILNTEFTYVAGDRETDQKEIEAIIEERKGKFEEAHNIREDSDKITKKMLNAIQRELDSNPEFQAGEESLPNSVVTESPQNTLLPNTNPPSDTTDIPPLTETISPGEESATTDEDGEEAECGTGTAGVRSDDASGEFNPTLTVTKSGTMLTFAVSDEQGQDVQAIRASFPKSAIDLSSVANGTNLLTASSTANSGATLSCLKRDAGANDPTLVTVDGITVGAPPLFVGNLRTPGDANIAIVQIFEDGDFYHLQMTYTQASSLETEGGATTMVINTGVFARNATDTADGKAVLVAKAGGTITYCRQF